MLFQREHIQLIKQGKKTATRRDWKQKMAKEGGVYPCQTHMFQPNDEVDVFILAKEVYKQALGAMTEEDAHKEGARDLEAFKEVWKDINGSWDPALEVWVVEFDVVFPMCYHCQYYREEHKVDWPTFGWCYIQETEIPGQRESCLVFKVDKESVPRR